MPLENFDYKVVIKPEAIDVNGHVNNVFYITWMQNAAVAHSAANGLERQDYEKMERAWLVGSHFIEYFRPIFIEDMIVITTWVERYGKRDALRRYDFMRGDKCVAKAWTKWVFVNTKSGRSVTIPDTIRAHFIERRVEDQP